MTLNDEEAYSFYANPENRVPSDEKIGGPRSERSKMLSQHVPVRFAPRTVAKVRTLAMQDGTSVSGWIRQVVEKAVEKRMPEPTTRTYGEFWLSGSSEQHFDLLIKSSEIATTQTVGTSARRRIAS